MYNETYKLINYALKATEYSPNTELTLLITNRLLIYKLGEISFWWDSNIFTDEGLLYMKSMFPNTYIQNMIIIAFKTAHKVERDIINSNKDFVTYFALTDEIEDSLSRIIEDMCSIGHEYMIKVVNILIDAKDSRYLEEVPLYEDTKPVKVEPPKIYFGEVSYSEFVSNRHIYFERIYKTISALLLGYRNSEERMLNVGYYHLI